MIMYLSVIFDLFVNVQLKGKKPRKETASSNIEKPNNMRSRRSEANDKKKISIPNTN